MVQNSTRVTLSWVWLLAVSANSAWAANSFETKYPGPSTPADAIISWTSSRTYNERTGTVHYGPFEYPALPFTPNDHHGETAAPPRMNGETPSPFRDSPSALGEPTNPSPNSVGNDLEIIEYVHAPPATPNSNSMDDTPHGQAHTDNKQWLTWKLLSGAIIDQRIILKEKSAKLSDKYCIYQ
ncbi:hypothetical protein H4R33_000889 [Dimargaris cristalligena]|nr:hypothetical protein H4R33_000889 [Dimargaris cristalligena]